MIHKFRPFIVLCLAGITVGCSNLQVKTPSLSTETPVMTMSNMTPLLNCVGLNLQQTVQRKGSYLSKLMELRKTGDYESLPERKGRVGRYLVVINQNDFMDGTVRRAAAVDGKLSDVSSLQLKAIFARWFPNSAIVVTANDIPILRTFGLPGSLFTNFGTLLNKHYEDLKKVYNVDDVYLLSGSFSKLDGDFPVNDSGYGLLAGSKGSSAIGELEFGRSKNTNVLGLNVILGRVNTNEAIASTLVEARIHRSSAEIKFKILPGEASGSVSRKVVLSEGIHGAQHMLLEAAAMWFVSILFNQDVNLESCFTSPKANPAILNKNVAKWDSLSELEKVSEIQAILLEKGFLSNEYESGELDEPTITAIRKYELSEQIYEAPHLGINLDDLYIRLKTGM